MDYKRIYDNLISLSKSRHLTGYTERHHIIPKCMGGTDDIQNIAVLTAAEHFVAHQLLVKIYPSNSKLLWAVRMMTAARSVQIRNNKEYSWIKKRIAQHLTKTRTGVKTGKQRIYHAVDPYVKAADLALHFDTMILYKNNPYRSAEEVASSSRLFVSFL